MRKITFFISLLLCGTAVFCQEKANSVDGMRKNGISFNFLGTTPVVGITYERIVTQYTSLELGVGSNSVGAGVKIMPFKIKESTMMFTTGFTTTYADYKDGFLASGKRVQLYLPIGVNYYGTKGFNFGIDVGPAYRMHIDSTDDDNGFLPWGGIKIGQRF